MVGEQYPSADPRRATGLRDRLLTVGDSLMWISTGFGVLGLAIPGAGPLVRFPVLVLAPVAMVLTCLRVSRLAWMTTLGLSSVGIVLILAFGVSAAEAAEALTAMTGLFAFIAVVRLLELPLLRRHLDEVLAERATRAKREGSLLWPGAILTGAMTSVLSFGAIPMAYRSLHTMFGTSSHAAAAGVVGRSFVTANSLTPLAPPLVLGLAVVELSWLEYAPIGLLVVLVGAVLIPFGPRPSARMNVHPVGENRGSIREFLLVLAAVLVMIIGFQALIPGISVVGASILTVVIVLPLWEFLMGGLSSLPRRMVVLATSERTSWRGQYVLLVSSGLLVAAVVHWGQRSDALAGVSVTSGWTLLTLAAIPPAIAALAVIGVYPMTSLLLVCAVVPAWGDGLWPVLVVGAAVLGVHVGFLISPISAMTLVMSAMTGAAPTRIGLRWNLLFGTAFLMLGTMAIVLLAWLLGY